MKKLEKLLQHEGIISKRGTKEYEEQIGAQWNKMTVMDREQTPEMIIQVETKDQIAAVMTICHKEKVKYVFRGGGHSITGNSIKGTLMIDGRKMTKITLENDKLSISPGNTWNDMDTLLQKHGRYIVGGMISTTGGIGLTIGGGIGWLSRKLGITAHHIEELEMVIPPNKEQKEARIIRLNKTQINQLEKIEGLPEGVDGKELFWAMAGTGRCFGIVSRLVLNTFKQEAAVVSTMQIAYPLPPTVQQETKKKRCMELLEKYATFLKEAPSNTYTAYAFVTSEMVMFYAMRFDENNLKEGTEDTYFKHLIEDEKTYYFEKLPYATLNSNFDSANGKGYYYWTRSRFFKRFDEDKDQFENMEFHQLPIGSVLELVPFDVHQHQSEWSSFAHIPKEKGAHFEVHCIHKWEHAPSKENYKHLRNTLTNVVSKVKSTGSYVNYEIQDATTFLKYGEHAAKLAQLKEKVDPFHNMPLL